MATSPTKTVGRRVSCVKVDQVTVVYALHDPTDESVRVYVGVTSDLKKRMHAHLAPSQLRKERNIKAKWISSLVRRGARPEMVVLEEVPPFGDYEEAERYWIAAFRLNGMSLANSSDGGNVPRGYSPPAELRAQWSKANRGRKMPREAVERTAAASRGRQRSPETRQLLASRKRAKAAKGETGFKGVQVANKGRSATVRYVAYIRDKGRARYDKRTRKWIALSPGAATRRRRIGSFETKRDAVEAREAWLTPSLF